MNPVNLDHIHDIDRHMEETSAEMLLLPSSRDIDKIFKDREIFPRVGDQHQVEIPPPLRESYWFLSKPTHLESTRDEHRVLVMGLPIPVMWVNDQLDDIKLEKMEFRGDSNNALDRLSHTNLENQNTKLKVEFLDVKLESKKVSDRLQDGKLSEVKMEADLPSPKCEKCSMGKLIPPKCEKCSMGKLIPKGLYPVPGSLGNSWSDIEQKSFLLGLYIFGKNFDQLKKFIESKDMGDIQSYYYGRFYKSDGYRRWSEGRKITSRKSIHGEKIFTGSRQQELLSRLLPLVSEDCKNYFLQVFKSFGEATISLEDFVSTLKAIVGIQTLTEAVGIGKGKQDLTSIIDPVRTSQVNHVHREIPSGKECNSLTSMDIVKFLTGDRLSKARSNDLFWEAVWPRLLARGWNSEQPKSRGSLVFLTPGVKKFSRRRHVKGKHYFDSVSDVLNKVALDPTLLDVEEEAPRDNGCLSGLEGKSEEDILLDQQQHCYLRPRVSNSNSELMKFTVIDTTLIHEEGSFKMTELRPLPVDTFNNSTPSSISRETVGESSNEPMDEPDSVDMLSNHQQENKIMKRRRGVSNEKCSKKLLNGKLNQRAKQDQSNHVGPAKKRRRLTACSKNKTIRNTNNISMDYKLKGEDPSSHLDSLDATSENMVTEVGLSQEKVSTSSSSKVNPDNNDEVILGQEVNRRTLIDLNLPHVQLDLETRDPFVTEMGDSQDDGWTKGLSLSSQKIQPEDPQKFIRTSNGVSSVEEQPTVNVRRQSTRNRPLTAKALEALACGYLETNRKTRDKKIITKENSFTRPSRRVRRKVNVATESVGSKMEEGIEEECSSDATKILTLSQVQSDIEGSRELLGVPRHSYNSETFSVNYN